MEYKRRYESLEKVLEAAEGPTDMPVSARSSERAGDRDFRGTGSLAESLRLARHGWPEGRERMSAMHRRLTDLIRQRVNSRQEVMWDVAGATVDVGRFCEGCPENMMYFEPAPMEGKGRIVKVSVNVSASCAIEAEDIYWRGAAVIGLCDLLEANGFSVEIEVFEGTSSGRFGAGDRLEYWFPAKVHGYQLDVDRLAFVLANPSFLRRVMLAVAEREPRAIRSKFDVGGTYGCPAEMSQEPSGAEVGITVPSLKSWERTFRGEDGAARWVLEQARAVLGVDAVSEEV
jgi:hypothetical protein